MSTFKLELKYKIYGYTADELVNSMIEHCLKELEAPSIEIAEQINKLGESEVTPENNR